MSSEHPPLAAGQVLAGPSLVDGFFWQPSFGPEHPAGHGPVTFELTTESGRPDPEAVITSAKVRAQLVHRGAEKLFESRDYRQIMMLGDRHDWNSSFGSELGLALTIEGALGITAPVRATWLRTLMAELNRIIHHLRWVGESVGELGEPAGAAAARDLREQLVALHESYSGGRLHPMLVQPGGMRLDVPDGWLDQLGVVVAGAPAVATQLRAALASTLGSAGAPTQPGAAGTLTRDQAVEFGVSGPVARASGLELDLRIDEPYCAYDSLIERGILVSDPTSAGDNSARFEVLLAEIEVSAQCVLASIGELEAIAKTEPIAIKLPRSIRLPHGTCYGWTENPTGINGWLITSTGGPNPYRVKLRTASFNNAQALEQVLVGAPLSELKLILMSWQITSGDLGK